MNHYNKEQLIRFEDQVKLLWEAGRLPYLTHLCGGNEDQLIHIFEQINPIDWVFSTHRAHYHYLLKGGTDMDLIGKILDGKSMFLFNNELKFFSSSLVAGTPAIAAGVAMALQRSGREGHVWCFVGDGAEDEGHFYEAVKLVDARELPCTFVIEDNDRNVETSKKERWGFINDRNQESWDKHWPNCVHRYHYTPVYPHAGSGCKHHITFIPHE